MSRNAAPRRTSTLPFSVTRLAAIVSVLTMALVSGCSILGITFGDSATKSPAATAGARRYTGPECKGAELRKQHETREKGTALPGDPPAERERGSSEEFYTFYGDQPDRHGELRDQVHALVCPDQLSSYPKRGSTSAHVALHYDFNDRSFDHSSAAVILVTCFKLERCLADAHRHDPTQHERFAAGHMDWYSKQVDPKRVDAEMTEAGVSEPVRRWLLADLERARDRVAMVRKKLGAVEKEVFVEIPNRVRQQQKAYYAAYQKEFQELDGLGATAESERAQGVSAATIAKLEDLRARYVKRCGKPDCMHDGLASAVARQLFFAHVSHQDTTGAKIETLFVDPTGPHGQPTAVVIARQQKEVMAARTKAQSQVERAQSQGLDRETAKTTAGGVQPYDFSETRAWDIEKVKVPNYVGLIPGRSSGLHKVVAKVRTKQTKGGQTKLVFEDVVSRYKDEVCRDTNRIDRVSSGGRIEYKQRCRLTGKTIVHRRKIDPVVVPAPEAKPLQRGDSVSVWALTGKVKSGRIWTAHRSDRLVQLRGVRVKGEKRKRR